MGRRNESEVERAARERLKERHDKELDACGAFFAVADRRVELEAELEAVGTREAVAVAKLAELMDPSTVARLVGWSATKVRAAAKMVEAGASATGSTGVHTAAEVAG